MLEIIKEPYVSLFIIILFGVLLSRIEIKNIGLGSSAIVISAIFFGYFGMQTPPAIEKIGLILFIFAVGIQAGPGFFESFKTGEARQYLLITTITLLTTALVSSIFAYYLDFDYFLTAGLFSGVTTSTPTLAAILENGNSNAPVTIYAISYPIALVTTVFAIRIMTKFLSIDLKAEEESYKKEISSKVPQVNIAYFKVNNPNIFNRSIKDINFHELTKLDISRIKRANESSSFIPSQDTIIHKEDTVKVIGDKKSLKSVSVILGEFSDSIIRVPDKELTLSILVTSTRVVGKSLKSLNLNTVYGAEITEIRRAGVNIIPKSSTRLRYGDKILSSVRKESSHNFVEMLGGVESSSINFLPISIAIVLGIVIGQFSIPIGSTNVGPGITGGILFTTLVLGKIGKTGPMLWAIAGKTNQFLRELGMMFFLCGVGSNTGQSLISSLSRDGVKTIFATVLINIISITLVSIVAIKVIKINKLRFLGALAGSFTCSAALPSPEDINNSSIPLTAYSVTYPFALLMTISIGQLFLFFN
ncbi:MAG: putative transport protein [Bacteriovoracaceae bacterium]|jgi:putative transport protein